MSVFLPPPPEDWVTGVRYMFYACSEQLHLYVIYSYMFCAVLSLTPRMLGTPGKYCQLVKILRKQLCMGYCFHTQEGGGKKKCIEDVDQ